MSVSACAALSGELLLGREEKLSWDQRETRPGVTQTGGESGGGGRQKRGIETEGKKNDGQAEGRGRGD